MTRYEYYSMSAHIKHERAPHIYKCTHTHVSKKFKGRRTLSFHMCLISGFPEPQENLSLLCPSSLPSPKCAQERLSQEPIQKHGTMEKC